MINPILLLILFTCLFTVVPRTLMSQETSNSSITRLGVRGGINFTNLYTKDASGYMALGIDLGAFGKIPLSDKLSVQPEINFAMKGANVKYNSIFVNGDAKYHFNYLEIPFLGVVSIADNISLHAGPYIAYLLSGSITNGPNNNFDFESRVNPDNYNRIDYGAAIGASLDIDKFGLGMRFTQGFSTIGNEIIVFPNTIKFPDAANFKYCIYLAYSFN